MAFEAYFDLRLRQDPDIPEWDRLGRLWHLVHSASYYTKVPFAVAFPGWMQAGFGFGGTLRVFALDRTQADALYDALEKMPQAADLAEGSRVRVAPASLRREAYLMHRIPSAPCKERKTVPLERAQALRQESLRRRIAQQQSLPFVKMRSSSGNSFRLVVERIDATGSPSGTPNSYGLSRSTQIVALPLITAP